MVSAKKSVHGIKDGSVVVPRAALRAHFGLHILHDVQLALQAVVLRPRRLRGIALLVPRCHVNLDPREAWTAFHPGRIAGAF